MWRSSSVPITQKDLSSSRSAGWSNVLSHGSVAVADWQRISKRQSPARLPGRSSLTSASSQDGSQELEINHNHYESDTYFEELALFRVIPLHGSVPGSVASRSLWDLNTTIWGQILKKNVRHSGKAQV